MGRWILRGLLFIGQTALVPLFSAAGCFVIWTLALIAMPYARTPVLLWSLWGLTLMVPLIVPFLIAFFVHKRAPELFETGRWIWILPLAAYARYIGPQGIHDYLHPDPRLPSAEGAFWIGTLPVLSCALYSLGAFVFGRDQPKNLVAEIHLEPVKQ